MLSNNIVAFASLVHIISTVSAVEMEGIMERLKSFLHPDGLFNSNQDCLSFVEVLFCGSFVPSHNRMCQKMIRPEVSRYT